MPCVLHTYGIAKSNVLVDLYYLAVHLPTVDLAVMGDLPVLPDKTECGDSYFQATKQNFRMILNLPFH